jgi:hypothetical protein
LRPTHRHYSESMRVVTGHHRHSRRSADRILNNRSLKTDTSICNAIHTGRFRPLFAIAAESVGTAVVHHNPQYVRPVTASVLLWCLGTAGGHSTDTGTCIPDKITPVQHAH